MGTRGGLSANVVDGRRVTSTQDIEHGHNRHVKAMAQVGDRQFIAPWAEHSRAHLRRPPRPDRPHRPRERAGVAAADATRPQRREGLGEGWGLCWQGQRQFGPYVVR